jgi:hypothetical protein
MPRVPVLVRWVWAVGYFVLKVAGDVPGLLQQSLKFPYLFHIFPSTPPCKIHRLANEPNSLAHFLVADAISA